MYYVYIISNWNRRVLYTGFTNDIENRTYQNKHKLTPGFTSKYNCNKLLYYEEIECFEEALHREKQLKRYLRTWKFNLIKKMNPKFEDLYQDLAPIEPFNNAGKKSRK